MLAFDLPVPSLYCYCAYPITALRIYYLARQLYTEKGHFENKAFVYLFIKIGALLYKEMYSHIRY